LEESLREVLLILSLDDEEALICCGLVDAATNNLGY
jgi:hypothetical protein